ncbi:MAG: peptidoglycan-binding domain-containing protein [Cyanobacteria bacterium J06634_5]
MRFQQIKAEHRLDELTLEILHEGDYSFAVKQLQHRLTRLGHYHAEITGQFDTPTRIALETFQKEYRLSEVGFFGPASWYALTFWSQETRLASPVLSRLLEKAMTVAIAQVNKLHRKTVK